MTMEDIRSGFAEFTTRLFKIEDRLRTIAGVRWAVVRGVNPLRVQYDLSDDVLPGSPSSAVGALNVGDRCLVLTYNNRAVVIGRASIAPDCPVGAVLEWYATETPPGYLRLEGQAVSRTTYSTLFALWGTQFGNGNGSTTFNLPDRRGRVAVGLNPADSEFNTLGKHYGTKTHTLTTAQIPSHSHGVRRVNGYAGGGSWSANDQGASSGGSIVQTNNAGGGGAHNNIQPSITAHFIVRAL